MKLIDLFESPIDVIEKDLRDIGYDDFIRKSGKTLAVLTDKNRTKVIEDIVTNLPNVEYDETPTARSSLGLIHDPRGVSIMVKPNGRQGSDSAGVGNESILVEQINSVASEENPITVIFSEANKTYTVKMVVRAEGGWNDN